ncbi:helix-turn-helix transcriptional regulator [Pseudoalteromonas neustonica]|uniref:helix-turn-helix transcriptional regulator n=1 Tax=Pseudoalteromonas neustonica TaxID=1840331 RepID=UPI0007DB1199|nr:AlpA family phage regulatory protein [Pseudoalteromonas neustonica]
MSQVDASKHYRTNLRGEVITINDRYLRPADVAEKCGIHRSTIYRLIERGEFPKSHKASSGRVVWVEEDIEEWMRLGAEKFHEFYGKQQAN